MDIKNHKNLIIRPTYNGVIVSDHARDGYPSYDLAVFNDPDEMAEWIKRFFLDEPLDKPDVGGERCLNPR